MYLNYLLYIDQVPAEEDVVAYFAKFNTQLIQQQTLEPLPKTQAELYTIIMHWSSLENNLAILHQVFTNYPVPFFIINDVADDAACISALELGADDFLIKPLNPRALHARITAIQRRVGQLSPSFAERKTIHFANWRMVLASRQLFDENNQELVLSAGEYALLSIFVQKPHCDLTRETLLEATQHSALSPLDRRIDVQISRLRQKIEPDPQHPTLIKTVRNKGYRFCGQVVRGE